MKKKHSVNLKKSIHLFNVINIIQCAEGIYNFTMLLVFFEFLASNGQRDGINTEAGTVISRIGFDVVNLQAKLAKSSDEILEVIFIFELEVNFKVIGTVFENRLCSGKEGETGKNGNKANKRNHVKSASGSKTKETAAPKCNRGSETFNLVL